MGYYNNIYQQGENSFLQNCKKSGVDGLIVVDLPWPENKKFAHKCKKYSITLRRRYTLKYICPTITNNHDLVLERRHLYSKYYFRRVTSHITVISIKINCCEKWSRARADPDPCLFFELSAVLGRDAFYQTSLPYQIHPNPFSFFP